MSRRLLQIVIALLGGVPALTGVLTMFGVKDPLYADSGLAAIPVLDRNLRFFGGLWLAFGLAVWALVPAIERRAAVCLLAAARCRGIRQGTDHHGPSSSQPI